MPDDAMELEPGTGVEGAAGAEQAPAAGAAQEKGGFTTLLDGDVSGKGADGAKGAEDPQSKGGEADATAPEKYELKAPEDTTWTPEQLTAFEGQARELGLTGAQAQKLLETAHANQQAAREAHATQVTRWAEEIRMDKEMGGANFEPTVMKAKAALKTLEGEEGPVGKLLRETGYGNHPEVVRMFARVADKIGGDKLITGKEAPAEKPLEERMYSNWKV